MYSHFKNVQILISLMKQFEIKDVVLSPGGSDIPLIHSLESDEFFTCYSVVDERSAAYFAMGIAQEKKQTVACVCTSGTAVCNYLPGITEAYYQEVPVLAITADKSPNFQDQLELQKIKQSNIFDGVVKKAVELPMVHTEEDEWLCNRLVNEAMLELTHHGCGPVHINMPILGPTQIFDCEQLPPQRKMTFVQKPDWAEIAKYLTGKKIMVVVGQNLVFSEKDVQNMNAFFAGFNCMFAVENLSNLKCDGTVATYPVTEMHKVGSINHLAPDLVISIGNNLAAYLLKPMLRACYKKMENWLISEQGVVRDAYKCLTNIFEMKPSEFFENISLYCPQSASHTYYELWNNERKKIELPELEYSNFYVAKRLSEVMPQNAILHTAILNSTRTMQFFDLADGITNYSNVGALGIDGCFSTFAGQAAAAKDKLCYLLIGDLSFFYDMNAAGLRSIGSNVRIILLNNGGGSEFQLLLRKQVPGIDTYICAEHDKVATGWIVSLGYDYYTASNKEEVDEAIEKMGCPSERPIFLEVFTDMVEDGERTNVMYDKYRNQSSDTAWTLKNKIGKWIPRKQKDKAKRIIQILKEK